MTETDLFFFFFVARTLRPNIRTSQVWGFFILFVDFNSSFLSLFYSPLLQVKTRIVFGKKNWPPQIDQTRGFLLLFICKKPLQIPHRLNLNSFSRENTVYGCPFNCAGRSPKHRINSKMKSDVNYFKKKN